MWRGAIIGLGNVAVHAHLPGWLDRRDVEIVAVTDARPAQRAEAAARLPGARWYDSADELLAMEGLDFVDICTPPSSHAGLVTAALRRGLHVLCEKPLVCSPGELTTVTQIAAATDRVLHTVHNWHHAPIVRRTWELVRDGAIGQVLRVVWHTLRTRPAATHDEHAGNWRTDPAMAGGGVLTDHGWHVFYVLRRWIGREPLTVSAALERRRHFQWPLEDTARLQLTFPGATAEVFLTWASDVRRNWVELTGTEGTLCIEDDTLVLTRRDGAPREQRWPCPPAMSDGSQHPDWFGPVAEQFLAEIDGSAPRGENLAEVSLCVALEASARESSQRGEQPIPLPLTRPAVGRGPSV